MRDDFEDLLCFPQTYQQAWRINVYVEDQIVCPFVGIGSPTPSPRKWFCLPPWKQKGAGGNTRLRVRGGGPNSDDWAESLVIFILCANKHRLFQLKGHGNETNFLGFCRNQFLMSPLHYLSSRSDFGFEFPEIFIFEKRFPAITDTRSRRPSHHQYGESAIEFFKRKLSVSMIRRVVDSLHQWYGESPTPRITDTESWRLRVSLSRGVDDSADRWYGELLFKEKINLVSIFRAFNG